MRFTILILISYFSFLLVSPMACNMFSECYETTEFVDLESPESDSPCTPCCSVQCCDCQFLPVERIEVDFRLIELTERIRSKNDQAVSNYLSECWRPPQLV